jgi:ABC-2 type transport system ATP-binding protein
MTISALPASASLTPQSSHPPVALAISALRHVYSDRVALAGVSFDVEAGEFFALLGPNGGGKTTLFRILSTLIRPTSGSASVFGADVVRAPHDARRRMGVVFQAPAIDKRLTVAENLRHHGHLFGLRGAGLTARARVAMDAMKIADRAGDLAGALSGGLQRRAEIAKALMTQPDLLLLDEPTTGLDPSARRDVRDQLMALREHGITVVMTTHLMDEAATCDRVAILHRGSIVALGRPAELVDTVGGDVVVIAAKNPQSLAPAIHARFGVVAEMVGDRLRIEKSRGHEFIPAVVEAFPGEIDSVTFGRPTLEDAFVHFTGERLE